MQKNSIMIYEKLKKFCRDNNYSIEVKGNGILIAKRYQISGNTLKNLLTKQVWNMKKSNWSFSQIIKQEESRRLELIAKGRERAMNINWDLVWQSGKIKKIFYRGVLIGFIIGIFTEFLINYFLQ